MDNSWSLLYDTMYGPEDEKNLIDWNKIYSGRDENFEVTADGFVWPKSNDVKNDNDMKDYLNSLNYTDTLSPSTGFNFNTPTETNKNGFWKYEEDKTLKEIEQYLSSTYHSHYTSETTKTQTLDLIERIGDAEAFTRSNAIKYLSRFGKKNGKSKQDILKAIHYCILLYHFAGLHKKTQSDFPY
jgi:hypothetical protein